MSNVSPAETWKYENEPGNEFVHLLVDFGVWTLFITRDRFAFRFNGPAGDTLAEGMWRLLTLTGPPTVTRVPGSSKAGIAIDHPQYSYQVERIRGMGRAECHEFLVGKPEYEGKWMLVEFLRTSPPAQQYIVSPPFHYDDVPRDWRACDY